MFNKNNAFIRPFVKWAGGKRQLIGEIQKQMPAHFNTYYEPFVGGGAVLFSIKPKHAVINDFNTQLINTYNAVMNNPEQLLAELSLHEQQNSKEHYYEVRAYDRDGTIDHLSSTQLAARMIYLNKTGFNGLFRVNSKNQINVPYGFYKHPAIVNESVINADSSYLNWANIQILSGDFEDAVKDVKRHDFVYFDPPYAPITSDSESFVGYTLNGFNEDSQVRLHDVVVRLAKLGAYVMVSNSDVPFIRDLYSDFASGIHSVQASRNINANAAGRGKVGEVIICTYPSDGE